VKYTDGENTIEVSKGAYREIYEPLGFYAVETEIEEKKAATKKTTKKAVDAECES